MQRADFTDGVSSCTGDHDIRESEEVCQFFFDIFELDVAIRTGKTFVCFALAAEMDDLELFQKFREDTADMAVDRSRSETSADHHEHRFL